ncbi:MAG: nucleotidyltransferase domain-containing protein [Muribaculaceae bacterium]|nr:nucleotidyltransferase domain-containing protein [Muribaculaceae bacterium]
MRNKIITLLHDLEQKHDIIILLAVNYGSRCFGYASAESDWDVRFIYVHRPQWYFSIGKTDDTIELMLEGEHLDIEGYDLKKALQLIVKTNPVESDWLHADDYYILDRDFLRAMQDFEAQCYNSHHAMYHFYSISVKHNQRYLDKELTLKRFIYYMRGLLSCRWVEENGSHPPVNIDELIDATITDAPDVCAKAHRLLALKRTSKAHDMAIVDAELAAYVVNLQHHYEKQLPLYKTGKHQADLEAMTRFLMDTVMQSRPTKSE